MNFESKLPILYVVAAVFQNDKGELLIVKRPKDKLMPDLWEFPGGKIEAGETPENALTRELGEEIGLIPITTIATPFVSHQYESFHIVLLPYLVTDWSGKFDLIEHQQGYAWVKVEDMGRFLKPATSQKVIDNLIKMNMI